MEFADARHNDCKLLISNQDAKIRTLVSKEALNTQNEQQNAALRKMVEDVDEI